MAKPASTASTPSPKPPTFKSIKLIVRENKKEKEKEKEKEPTKRSAPQQLCPIRPMPFPVTYPPSNLHSSYQIAPRPDLNLLLPILLNSQKGVKKRGRKQRARRNTKSNPQPNEDLTKPEEEAAQTLINLFSTSTSSLPSLTSSNQSLVSGSTSCCSLQEEEDIAGAEKLMLLGACQSPIFATSETISHEPRIS